MLITIKKHKAEIERLQARIREQDAAFSKACEILTRRNIHRDSQGRFLCPTTLDFNQARKAAKNGN